MDCFVSRLESCRVKDNSGRVILPLGNAPRGFSYSPTWSLGLLSAFIIIFLYVRELQTWCGFTWVYEDSQSSIDTKWGLSRIFEPGHCGTGESVDVLIQTKNRWKVPNFHLKHIKSNKWYCASNVSSTICLSASPRIQELLLTLFSRWQNGGWMSRRTRPRPCRYYLMKPRFELNPDSWAHMLHQLARL